jgi:glycosyltransferase involved in cell wall biosynthesis
MKILQICAVAMTMEKLLLPLMSDLRQRGHLVEGACSQGDEIDGLLAQGYIIHPMPIKRGLGFSNILSVWHLIRLLRRGKYDAVHVHTPVAAVLGRIAAKFAGTQLVVYTAHGFYFHENMGRGKRLIWEGLEGFFCRYFTDLLFCQSREDAEYAVQQKFLAKDRVYAIGNGVDIEKFSRLNYEQWAAQTRQAFNIPAQAPVVIFIGRAVAEKGIFELLEAFCIVSKALPETFLVIVGDNLAGERDQETLVKLQKLIEGNKQIIFAGKRDDIPEILAAGDVFVLPSWREGMPRSIIEAMAMELPVVATDIRGSREEVVDGETGYLVKLGDVDALAEAMMDVLKDPVKAQAMGRAGRRRAEELFDERVVIQRQISLLEELGARQGDGSPVARQTGN